MPRNIVFGCANSLDNFIARPDGAVDWLLWSDEVAKMIQEMWTRFDTLIMGRKTFDVMQGMSSDDPGMNPAMKTYVFTRSRSRRTAKGAEFVNSDAIAFVRKLKQQRGKEICCMGGGEFAQALFDAGLIDEVGVNIHPVLLGEGVPLFLPMKRQINLELKEVRQLPHGCITMTYRVKAAKSARSAPKRAPKSPKRKKPRTAR